MCEKKKKKLLIKKKGVISTPRGLPRPSTVNLRRSSGVRGHELPGRRGGVNLPTEGGLLPAAVVVASSHRLGDL